MRKSAIVLVAGLLGVFAGGPSGAAIAADAVARCVGESFEVTINPVTNRPTAQAIRMRQICEGSSVIVQRVDGTLRQQVRLTDTNDTPDGWGTWGSLVVPVANGVGTWLITHAQDASGTYPLSRPITFVVPRASIMPMREVIWSAAGRTYTIRTRVLKYTSTGALVPMAGISVKVTGSKYLDSWYYPITTLRSDANGWFTYSRKLTQEFQFQFATPPASALIAAAQSGQNAVFRPGVVLTSPYHSKVAIGVPTTVRGYAGPGIRVVGLSEYDVDSSRDVDTGARATTAADGTFVLRYTPWSGSDSMVLVTPPNSPAGGIMNPGLDVDVVEPTVRLTGKALPKSGTVVLPGTTMATYGNLTLADPNGVTTPFTNRRILVQARPGSTPTAPYRTVATATTTSTGYYYSNWTATVDTHVRVVYLPDGGPGRPTYTYIRYLNIQ
ncbi:hypothetical protein OG394_16180 [Kribbella sp. NBC_01245]|uniref:hypothetical protein n=1 Tax=Kribbella sp. NBC_01245 TaxID=2903578 RepID=UPI002E28E286|nr:hypothetical protein [Kribbella sp. NBC_01245]